MTQLAITDRLVLREIVTTDALTLYLLNSDTNVMRYTGDQPFRSAEAAADFIEGYEDYDRHGFGRWAVTLKDDPAVIGYCGLKRNEVNNEVDLGFRFFPQFWAHGYATEAGKVSLKLGFEVFGLPEILGKSMRENLPSVTVLQKLGMRFSEIREEENLIWLIYSMTRDDWTKADRD
jgi:RimJ/RimL family protein N-acetyltransferase